MNGIVVMVIGIYCLFFLIDNLKKRMLVRLLGKVDL